MKKSILIVGMLFSSVTFASEQVGKVIDIRVSAIPSYNPTHIKLDGPWNNKPGCATQPYWAVDTNTEGGKAFLSAILTAYSTGKTVQIWGSDQCTLRGDMENALQVALPQQ